MKSETNLTENQNVENCVIKIPALDYTPDTRGYGCFLYDHTVKHKDKIAQIDATSKNTDTYCDLLQRCVRTSVYLRKIGIKPRDFISVCTYNHLDACVPPIAAFFTNAVMSAVDPSLSLEDVVHLLNQTKPKVVFAIPESVEMIEDVAKRIQIDYSIIVFGDTDSHISFADMLADCTVSEADEFTPTPVRSLDDVAIVFFSSGTTGPSKGIVHRHYSLICQTINNANCGFNFDLSFGFYSPYWTVYGICLGTSIVTGTARLIVPRFDGNNPWEPFYHNPNYVILNVFQSLALCSQPKPKEVDVSLIQVIMVTGGNILSEQVQKLQCIFFKSKIFALYGQSEVFGYLSHFTPKDHALQLTKTECAGLGLPGISYKISDLEDGATLGPCKKGELCVKTKYAMIGYHNVDSSMAWDTDGWLKTGDIAYYDEDLCFYIVDRIKEMFKFRGWHVTPCTIEKVILQHPAVSCAIVLGVRHAYDGHQPMGVVLLKPGHSDVTEEQIQKFVDDQVEDRLRLRAGLKIVDQMPMTASGKINRWQLKKNLNL